MLSVSALEICGVIDQTAGLEELGFHDRFTRSIEYAAT